MTHGRHPRWIYPVLGWTLALGLERPDASAEELVASLAGEGTRGMTFAEAARLDLKNDPPGYHTARQRGPLIARFEAFSPGLRTERITSDVMRRFRASILARGASPNTAATQCRQLRTIYNRVCRLQGIPRKDILEDVDAVERYGAPKIPLTGEEVARLEKYAEKAEGWNAKAVHMWLFSEYCAGIRWGDLCRLTAGNLADGRVRIEQSKTDAGKNVKLDRKGLRLSKLYAEGPMIFGIDGGRPLGTDKASYGKISAANTLANRALKVAAKACGINKRLTTHMARHTFMQQGLEAEVHDRALQKLMGIGDQAYKHYRGSFSTDDLDKAHERIRKRRK